MPRKPQPPPIKLTKTQELVAWMQSKPIYTATLILFVIAVLLFIAASTKSSPKETIVENIPKNVTVNELNVVIEQLDKQRILIEKLQAQNNNLENTVKVLDKRIQANTDVLKRFCEYIIVITVDKKIIPRQCLPDYKWVKEEAQ